MPYSHEGYGLPESYPSEHRYGGRRESRAACAGVWTPDPAERPNRAGRRLAWARVPRKGYYRVAPKRVGWLPPRARAVLSRDLRRRNDLDRALATARGLAADAPECARFQGVERREQLDRAVRRARWEAEVAS